MNISKTSIIFASIALSTSAFALNYYCGQPTSEERNYKWSTCNWGSEISYESKNLPSKPGPNDTVGSRPGGYSFEIDVDANVLNLNAANNSELFAKGRKIKVKKNIGIGIALSNNAQTIADFNDCTIETNSINYSYWSLAKQAGLGIFRLEDSECTVKGNVSSNIPINPSTMEIEGRPGCAITLVGKSKLEIAGSIVIDALIKDQPDTWTFRFTLEDKDGNLPLLRVGKRFDASICDFNIKLGDKIKRGKYTLIDFHDRKTNVSKVHSFTLNGSDYKLGDPIKIGSFEGRLIVDKPTIQTRDRQTANDLVLEVK